MQIIIGSARADERKQYSGGKAGDQRQSSTPDYSGEVSMQPFYQHKKGWNIIRAKDITIANKIAESMKRACNNPHIGYSQSDRYGIIKLGTAAVKECNADCSSLVRQCVKEASGIDAGDFTTANAASKLIATGLFSNIIPYTSSTLLYKGDILCTKIKGHIVVVTVGNNRYKNKSTQTQYNGNSISLVEALKSLNINSSFANRKKIAEANGIKDYSGSATQNKYLLELLKQGALRGV